MTAKYYHRLRVYLIISQNRLTVNLLAYLSIFLALFLLFFDLESLFEDCHTAVEAGFITEFGSSD
jgi:hypothetical protein